MLASRGRVSAVAVKILENCKVPTALPITTACYQLCWNLSINGGRALSARGSTISARQGLRHGEHAGWSQGALQGACNVVALSL